MNKLAFQLYSARNFQPFSAFYPVLAAAGYDSVEGYGGIYADLDDAAVEALKTDLDANGLIMQTAHFGLDMLESDPAKVIRIAKALGMERVYCPHIAADLRPTNRIGWQAFAARLEAVGEKISAAGFGFGWHNHDFEFQALDDGTVPMQILLDSASTIEWEADIAWIIRGGADPFDWINRYGDRITAVHVKDIAPQGEATDEDGWADVGHGTVDWARLFTELRAKTPARLFIMEHDNPADATRFATRSIEWVRNTLEQQA